ncbi:ribosomal oxygenase 1 [Tribolium castaneum]|uniref:Bifunctional lysine-specific demethylase and histidyl-hydroxylase n=1 Tax=Tribolium castaneum TaxID=7070 RepID=D2A374_TRICA|nr:PREDICTED: bifunctional lysine-specific demethylase and histidyl-hydroxylase NO66 [Tribolium castaneum]EFA02272.1 Bifunctional lysine-specific demethylase and histidyl-hydroxylase NO66-like Protein [Tribolium castaneum]|eukprot:XP_974397.2 PREDICTED: bifunctional lysine-specific demethylase and histidyl-hydroxylase NO66 [Tribolium castaneum]
MPPTKNPDLQSVSAFLMYRKTSTNKEITKKRKNLKKNKKSQNIKKKIEEEITKTLPLKPSRRHSHSIKKTRDNQPEQIKKPLPSKKVNVRHSPERDFLPSRKLNGNHNQDSCDESITQSGFLPVDDPTEDAQKLFEWLIQPLSPASFFKTYWEQKPLYIKRGNRSYYTHILDSSSLDKILRNNSLFFTRNVDVVTYENGEKQVFNQEGRATPSALWDYYGNGCSIRVLNPQTYNHKVHLLLATLQEYFGTMVGANVYLTPPGSQGFAPHYDDIEAFVVQLEGRKHWKLYQPKSEDVLARFSSPNFKREDLGEPFMELTLNAGELLYFPRGTIHEGRTDEDSHSLHITVSVYQQTSYVDLLEHILPKALKKAADSDVEFRKGLPLNYLKDFGLAAGSKNRKFVTSKIKDLMNSLINYVDIDSAADQLGKKFMHDSMPPVLTKSEAERSSKADGPVLKDGVVKNRVEIDLDTRVRLLRYYCIRLVCEENSSPKLYYNTQNATVYHGEEEQWLELEPSMVPLIQMLQNTYPRYIEVEKLPLDDMATKMQLVLDLWEHGLLVTEYPLDVIEY